MTNWPLYGNCKLTFRGLALCQSESIFSRQNGFALTKGNAEKVSFQFLYGGQFNISTQLFIRWLLAPVFDRSNEHLP